MPDNEVNSFLKDLMQDQQPSILDKPLNLDSTEKTDEEPEKAAPVKKVEFDEDGYTRNRQGRRKREQDENLRSEVMQLTERIKVLSESNKAKDEEGPNYKKLLSQVYGNAGDDGKYDPRREQATRNLIAAFEDMKDSVKKEFLNEIQTRDSEAVQADREADNEVDNMLEQVEEDYHLDMRDNAVRTGFITLMEKMSPKYRDGNIKEFADADAVAEAYLELQKRGGSNRAKELADRSMTRSGESQPTRLPQNAVDRYMEEHGLAW